ncbi:unnamed protein product [Phytophthora lilii]|uniref:Unnamed protein product n=1 Tax=Phytophthora lilii TaxID=2077276 RepID=A0A9W6X219_9STRA|nr:unnamed protein product [Phytophthora lilii]
MRRGLPLTDIERGRIQGLHEAGYSQRQVSQEAWTSHLAVGPRATAACPYSGQGAAVCQATSAGAEAVDIGSHYSTCSCRVDWLVYSTMDNTLPLSTEDKRARDVWAWDMVLNKDPVRSWETIVFSDEKKWNLDGPDGFQNYWRDIRRPPRQTKRRQAGGGSVTVSAGFSAAGKTKLAVLQGKQNSDYYVHTVSEFLLPFAHLHYGTDFTFQQDGASIHRSKVSMEFLRDRRVYANGRQFASVSELTTALYEAWGAIESSTLNALIDSMPRRCQKCKKHGNRIDY